MHSFYKMKKLKYFYFIYIFTVSQYIQRGACPKHPKYIISM